MMDNLINVTPDVQPTAAMDRQVTELREWCERITGIDTNQVIGTEGWPTTFSGCLIQSFSRLVTMAQHDATER